MIFKGAFKPGVFNPINQLEKVGDEILFFNYRYVYDYKRELTNYLIRLPLLYYKGLL